jgi:hypothetical protein
MTSERRYLADLADVVSIEVTFRHEKFGSRVLASIEGETPQSCHNKQTTGKDELESKR